MPNVQEHVRFCVRDFGEKNRELCYMVNSWMDAPSRTEGGYHRTSRHNSIATPFKACAIYGDKPLDPTQKNLLISKIVLQHLKLDGLVTPSELKAWKWIDALTKRRTILKEEARQKKRKRT
jgi:hypothetical protein